MRYCLRTNDAECVRALVQAKRGNMNSTWIEASQYKELCVSRTFSQFWSNG